MALEDDLAEWSGGRPDWQKMALAMFCRNDSLTADDVVRIADELITGTCPAARALEAGEIRGTSTSGAPVSISAVTDVSGVNALLPGQNLTFAGTGLTVIYGDNGSGKSGYARLIREAVSARVKGDLLADVFAQRQVEQAATFEYAVGQSSAAWALGDDVCRDLIAVRFYDEECGDAYVTSASEINYRPSALTLLDRLQHACDRVQQELATRLSGNDAARPDLPLFKEGTKAKAFLTSITSTTSPEQIDEATTLDQDHDVVLAGNLQELARLQGSDPSKEKTRLVQLAAHWALVKDHVDRMAAAISAEALDQIQTEKNQANELRHAAQIASGKTFDNEPLVGVGSVAWRALWEAAREYSTTDAFHEHEFPVTRDGAICVLCQQPLNREAADRLARFEGFIKDTTSRDADAAERCLALRRQQLAPLETPAPALTTALAQLRASGQDVAAIETWEVAARATAVGVIEWIDGSRPDRPMTHSLSPSEAIEGQCQALIDGSEAIDASSFNEQIRALSADIAERQTLGQLAETKDNLLTEVERLKSRVEIEDARKATDTTGITRKATDLTNTYVTGLVRDHFTRETERLGLRRVTLNPTRGRRDKTLEHRPTLLGATVKADIDRVLSEGEQTALGLAGFLTEAAFDESKSAVVFDDPVSSLDAMRRSRVARRLVELAIDRQVIVFTHEATFVNALNKTARDLGVSVTPRSILRQGDAPGLTSNNHPWSVKDIPSRLQELKEGLARLRKERAQQDSEEYARRAQDWGGRLSQVWERAVNLDIVNELVDRGTNEVKPMKFRMLVGITQEDDTDFQSGYAKASEWAVRHDQAPETNFIAPDPDEMNAELDRFEAWFARIKRYKK